jgi:hypothetical protein
VRSLLLAFAISLLAHVLVLSVALEQRTGVARAPVLTITLTAALTASPALAAARAPSAAAPAVQHQATVIARPRQPAGRFAVAASAPITAASGWVAAAPAAAQAARVQERTAAALQPSRPQRDFAVPKTMDVPATPLFRPEVGDLGRQLAGRRLQSSVWVAADGSVEKAFVKRNEISEEVAGLLERALASVRFTPAIQDGQAVPSLLQARLCFDEAGALDAAPPECLRPEAGAAAEGSFAAPP